MQTYAIRDVVKLIITKEFYHSNLNPDRKKKAKTEETIFYDIMQYHGILFRNYSDDKFFNKKWMVNWQIISEDYPYLLNSFESIITPEGYYQTRITEEGIVKIREFLYELY